MTEDETMGAYGRGKLFMNINGDARNVKLRLKVSSGEVDYEGSEEFLKDHVIGIFERTLSEKPAVGKYAPSESDDEVVDDRKGMNLATASIASILSVDSGPELIIAAAARLQSVIGKENFTRKELLEEMKQGSGYYRGTYSRNLSSYINRLVRDKELHMVGTDTYALPAGKLTELKTIIDQHR